MSAPQSAEQSRGLLGTNVPAPVAASAGVGTTNDPPRLWWIHEPTPFRPITEETP